MSALIKQLGEHTLDYRIIAEGKYHDMLSVRQVTYFEGRPISYDKLCGINACGISIAEIKRKMEYVASALEKPILLGGKDFPAEYKPVI